MESDLCFERGTMIIDGSCPPGSSASLYMWKVESILIMWKNMDSIFIRKVSEQDYIFLRLKHYT